MATLKRTLCGVLALALLATAPLLAKVVTSGQRPGNFVFTGTALIPLNASGATSIGFSGKGRMVISYSAECETQGSWLSIQILVDGVPQAPTAGSSDAFCSDQGVNGSLDSYTTAHYTIATGSLSNGAHSVSVQATVVGAATDQGWLGDSSLVIQK